MVQSSRVPFTSELLQGIISLLFMKDMENFIMDPLKSLWSIVKSALLWLATEFADCSCDLSFHYVALLKKMKKHPLYEGIKVIKHITRVTSVANDPIAVPISSVKRKCMRIEFDAAHVYVCHLPNSFEKDWGPTNDRLDDILKRRFCTV